MQFLIFVFLFLFFTSSVRTVDVWTHNFISPDTTCSMLPSSPFIVRTSNETCTPKSCSSGGWGSLKIECTKPDLSSYGWLLKYDNVSSCAGALVSDGYVLIGPCIQMKASIGYMQFSCDGGHLYQKSYKNSTCTDFNSTMTDYIQDQCVNDYFSDNDQFTYMDDNPNCGIKPKTSSSSIVNIMSSYFFVCLFFVIFFKL